MEKIALKEAIIVEGKYDKIKVSRLFDTLIIPTDGFDIYRNSKNVAMIRQIAEKRGIIVLTDSDSAGMRIRGYIKQCVGNIPVKNAYIPEICGKEKRKTAPSKEGFLGVEGVDDSVIIDAVMKIASPVKKQGGDLKKADFYMLGVVGSPYSAKLRAHISNRLKLPVKISANRLLEVVNTVCTREEFFKTVDEIKQKYGFEK